MEGENTNKHKLKSLLYSAIKALMQVFTDKQKRKSLLYSAIGALVLMLTCYLFNNAEKKPVWTDWSTWHYTWLENVLDSIDEHFEIDLNQQRLERYENIIVDSAIFVDVSSAKVLLDNRTVITDRKVLLDFFKLIKDVDFRYILLDVFFSANETTGYDAELIDTLIRMNNRIVIAKDSRQYGIDKESIIDSRLDPIAFCDDWFVSTDSRLFKTYPCIIGKERTLAAALYEKATGRRIKRKGCFYFDGCHLVNKSPFVTFHCMDGGTMNYIDRILSTPYTAENFRESAAGKYIIVGDYSNDIHHTYSGIQYGPSIHWTANRFLAAGKARVHPMYALFLFLLYTTIIFFILQQVSIIDFVMSKVKFKYNVNNSFVILMRPLAYLLLSFISYTALLLFVSLVLYWVFDIPYNYNLPAVVFPLLKQSKQYNVKYYKNNQV